MSAAMRKLRKALDEYMDSGIGPSPRTRTLFANNPQESDELLRELFEAYDAGDKPDLDIEALLRVRLVVCLVHTEKSAAARQRKHELDAAYFSPPTCRSVIFFTLQHVVHNDEPPAHCEKLVLDYPAEAQALLATLLLKKTHERFYTRIRDEYEHMQRELDTLRGMIARTAARRIMVEIEDCMK